MSLEDQSASHLYSFDKSYGAGEDTEDISRGSKSCLVLTNGNILIIDIQRLPTDDSL
jgi:hypothetical protein